MEEGTKKTVMIVAVVVCLALAGAVTYRNTVGSKADLVEYSGISLWVVCTNQDCETQYSMDKQEFYEEARIKGKGFSIPPLTCKECGEDSILEAVKCAKCSEVFFSGAAQSPGALPDTCPQCGYSAFKEKRDNLIRGK